VNRGPAASHNRRLDRLARSHHPLPDHWSVPKEGRPCDRRRIPARPGFALRSAAFLDTQSLFKCKITAAGMGVVDHIDSVTLVPGLFAVVSVNRAVVRQSPMSIALGRKTCYQPAELATRINTCTFKAFILEVSLYQRQSEKGSARRTFEKTPVQGEANIGFGLGAPGSKPKAPSRPIV